MIIKNDVNNEFDLIKTNCGDNFMRKYVKSETKIFFITIPTTLTSNLIKITEELFEGKVNIVNNNITKIDFKSKGFYISFFRFFRDIWDDTPTVDKIYELKENKKTWSLLYCTFLIMYKKVYRKYTFGGGFLESDFEELNNKKRRILFFNITEKEFKDKRRSIGNGYESYISLKQTDDKRSFSPNIHMFITPIHPKTSEEVDNNNKLVYYLNDKKSILFKKVLNENYFVKASHIVDPNKKRLITKRIKLKK